MVDYKDLSNRAASDKILHDKALTIAKNPTYEGYKRGLASVVCNFFNKRTFLVEQLKLKICQT